MDTRMLRMWRDAFLPSVVSWLLPGCSAVCTRKEYSRHFACIHYLACGKTACVLSGKLFPQFCSLWRHQQQTDVVLSEVELCCQFSALTQCSSDNLQRGFNAASRNQCAVWLVQTDRDTRRCFWQLPAFSSTHRKHRYQHYLKWQMNIRHVVSKCIPIWNWGSRSKSYQNQLSESDMNCVFWLTLAKRSSVTARSAIAAAANPLTVLMLCIVT